MQGAMTIRQVAQQAGLRASAIRYYEKAGLIPKPVRAGGQRRYDRTILDRLAVLEFAKDCGFTLAEARELLNGFRDEAPLSQRLHNFARKKIIELEAQARRIAAMKELLERAQGCRCLNLMECGRNTREKPGCRRQS